MLPETLDLRRNPLTLIHHAANCGHQAPPSSLKALEACLDAGAAVVEIDVIPLADSSFALLHGQHLEADTNGKGSAPQMKRAQIENLYYVIDGKVTDEKVGFLEGAIQLLQEHPDTHRLQLDLKPFTPLTQGVLREFCRLIEPVRERIQVTSVSDWAVRALAKFSPDLSIGFDPLLYLDLVDNDPRPEDIPPFHVGAYGLLDDHPLSAYQWGRLGEYFAARAGALLVQAPAGCDWFIRAELLSAALDAGFDWIEFLHQQESVVDGWTIDADDPESIKLAQRLVEHGVDMLTTDQPSKLAPYLPAKTIL
jgi:glycerophosphoryl diester phosphodiesterase